MSRSTGFILLEYVVAFGLTALAIFMLASIFGEFYLRISHYSAGCLTTVEDAKAWFLLDRDLSAAPRDSALWKKRAPSEIIWTATFDDVGWLLKKDRLMRIHGFYDPVRGTWHHAGESVVAMGVKQFQVRLFESQKLIDGCEVVLDVHNHVVKYVVACRDYRMIKSQSS